MTNAQMNFLVVVLAAGVGYYAWRNWPGATQVAPQATAQPASNKVRRNQESIDVVMAWINAGKETYNTVFGLPKDQALVAADI